MEVNKKKTTYEQIATGVCQIEGVIDKLVFETTVYHGVLNNLVLYNKEGDSVESNEEIEDVILSFYKDKIEHKLN
jgi:hypothetical protein